MALLTPKPPVDGLHLVLYDGECGLCDRAVSFLLARDRSRVLTFAPLQGPTARAIRDRLSIPRELDSLIFVRDAGGRDERLLVRSSAVLAILEVMGGRWRIVSWLRVMPAMLRDALYIFVAKRRAIWFGRRQACRMPEPSDRDRFRH